MIDSFLKVLTNPARNILAIIQTQRIPIITRKATVILCTFIGLVAVESASAYYDPGVQRWINRDPLGEAGFRKVVPSQRGNENWAQLYALAHNHAINKIDPKGLAVWLCTVPTEGFPFYGIGRHAYLWDDRSPIADHSCSMQGSSGSRNTSDRTDIGPIGGGDDDYWSSGSVECHKVPGSEGNENQIMDRCRSCANPVFGPVPGIIDCHTQCEKVLRDGGFPPPPHRRFDPGTVIAPEGWPPPW